MSNYIPLPAPRDVEGLVQHVERELGLIAGELQELSELIEALQPGQPPEEPGTYALQVDATGKRVWVLL